MIKNEMKRAGTILCIFAIWLLTTPVHPDQARADEGPPVVVRTFPPSGGADIDPSVNEIKVEFSREMTDKSWSWVSISPENSPKFLSPPRYLDDGRTCVVPVRLEPGKTYIIWLNTQKFARFKDRNGRSAVPYLLMFDTRK
jgi:RNA polymerase sigma-70 factor (ECF subfamily)